jgi:DNA repair protein RadC
MSQEKFARFLVRGDGNELREASSNEIVVAARDIMSRKLRRGASMTSPKLVKDFLSLKLGSLEHETFCVMLLDKRHRLIEYVELFRGTVDGASVHPREVVKLALAKNAAAVLCAHPHPLGGVRNVTHGGRRRRNLAQLHGNCGSERFRGDKVTDMAC